MTRTMPDDVSAAVEHCAAVIRDGSRSFALAARIFDRATLNAAVSLYGWCRYCDDQIDSASGAAAALERVEDLRRRTAEALSGKPQSIPVFIAFQHVTAAYGVPHDYPLELIEGMAMDARGERYETLDDLLLYCYRVAGTVGLMMAHVMGVSDEKALRHAADMGTAMQLTNIARDLVEDHARGRIYLPLSWLAEAGIPPEELAHAGRRRELAALARRLLAAADGYYRSGDAGLRYLPLRSACAVAAARRIYAGIGERVLRRKERAWDSRTYTTGPGKLALVVRGLAQVAGSLPQRAAHPWSGTPIRSVWRFQRPVHRVHEP